jgi:hypothetical protein
VVHRDAAGILVAAVRLRERLALPHDDVPMGVPRPGAAAGTTAPHSQSQGQGQSQRQRRRPGPGWQDVRSGSARPGA